MITIAKIAAGIIAISVLVYRDELVLALSIVAISSMVQAIEQKPWK